MSLTGFNCTRPFSTRPESMEGWWRCDRIGNRSLAPLVVTYHHGLWLGLKPGATAWFVPKFWQVLRNSPGRCSPMRGPSFERSQLSELSGSVEAVRRRETVPSASERIRNEMSHLPRGPL